MMWYFVDHGDNFTFTCTNKVLILHIRKLENLNFNGTVFVHREINQTYHAVTVK